MPKTVSPLFTHDCPRCTFLGTVKAFRGTVKAYDLYVCPGTSRPSLIARFGDEGAEYKSVRASLVTPSYPDNIMQTAKAAAIDAGVLPSV